MFIFHFIIRIDSGVSIGSATRSYFYFYWIALFRFVRSRLELTPVPGNHLLIDPVGDYDGHVANTGWLKFETLPRERRLQFWDISNHPVSASSPSHVSASVGVLSQVWKNDSRKTNLQLGRKNQTPDKQKEKTRGVEMPLFPRQPLPPRTWSMRHWNRINKYDKQPVIPTLIQHFIPSLTLDLVNDTFTKIRSFKSTK